MTNNYCDRCERWHNDLGGYIGTEAGLCVLCDKCVDYMEKEAPSMRVKRRKEHQTVGKSELETSENISRWYHLWADFYVL